MNKRIESLVLIPFGVTIKMCFLAVFGGFICSQLEVFAADEFQDLVNQIPRSANAVVLLNMEQAKNSPLGLKENWKAKIENAFEDGMIRVPPQATRFVLASQIDFEFKEPLWEAAIIDLEEEFSMEQIAKLRPGTSDTIENLPALALPNDTYLVQLGPKTLGAMAPANRQAVVRWIREVRKPSPPPLSPYLQKAAFFSDNTGSEIIMAIDLDGVMSFERVGKYLKSQQKNLDEWGAKLYDLTHLLCNMEGIRIGVRIGEPSSARIVVDLRGDASPLSSFAKPLFLQVLSDLGASIDGLQSWTSQAKGREISLAGSLNRSGLRRLLSVIDSPDTGEGAVAKTTSQVSPGDLPAIKAKASRDHFRAVVGMFTDLKEDMRNSKNIASSQLWFDKYAKRIERLPILNVDEEVLIYSAFVASQMRKATSAVKTMGIQTGVREAQVTASGGDGYGGYGYDGYGYGGYRYGAYGRYAERAEVRAVGTERRAIRAQETGAAATDVQQLRQEVISATTDIRRKMTQKYQVEF